MRSTPGLGSEFTVKLPMGAAIPDHLPPAEKILLGIHVLIITRDATLGQHVQSYCIAAGARVTLSDIMPMPSINK